MKLLIPLLTLFLASCSVHNHRYDAEEDVYYQEDYYAYDNYDPYYGYGSGQYSTAGDGVYYNNYNYYPDRWGITYSNVYYSPYRYPRVGFYFSSAYNCGYSYWTNWCGSGFWSPSHWWHRHQSWASWGYSWWGHNSFYYDNYWWYNHWRNRTYNHHRPRQHGYYSARNEARRLSNGRYNNRYKSQSNQRYNGNSRSRAVSRERSRGSHSTYRGSGRTVNQNRTNRSSGKPPQRVRQQASYSRPSHGVSRGNDSAKEQVSSLTNNGLQQQIRENQNQRYQRTLYQNPKVTKELRTRNRVSSQTAARSAQSNNRHQVKPMNSQSPVYHTNRRPVTAARNQATNTRQSNTARQRNRSSVTPTQRAQPKPQSKPRNSQKSNNDNNRSKQQKSSASRSSDNKGRRNRSR